MLKLGVDVGGTFTDLVVFDQQTGETRLLKSSTTPRDPSRGVLHIVGQLDTRDKTVESMVHASTVGTNLFLGQTGLRIPRGALVTTAGFRDILEIGRQKRPELYNLFFERPQPLIPRRLRFTLTERMDYRGRILQAIKNEELENLLQRLEEEDIETVAIVFLHAYANPAHELIVKDFLKNRLPDVAISTSHEVDPEYREFERTSTTVVNSLLIPVISRYLDKITSGLTKLKIDTPVFIMQSNGGLATTETASRLPVATIESGPATGVTAAVYWGKQLTLENILSFDMGGTTAKAGAVIGGVPQMVGEYEVGGAVHAGRTVKGSGYPVRYPFVDLAEVSGGGGTIAWLEQDLQIRVGPVSAGADPGPACYGKGGDDPTVTDANLLLGRLNPEGLSGGEIKLFPKLAEQAIRKKLADPLGISVVRAAHGILEIVNQHMMRALRLVSIERGYDPRSFTMLAFGGSGPMHAAFLAETLDIETIYIPPNCGVFSAYGLLLADFRHDLAKSLLVTACDDALARVEELHAELEREAAGILRSEGFAPEQNVVERRLDMRYIGQSFELTVPMKKTLQDTITLFHSRHREIYGYATSDEPVEIVNVRLAARGITKKPVVKPVETHAAESNDSPITAMRNVYFHQTGWVDTPIYSRVDLRPGNLVDGPSIIEQFDATTVVPQNWNARVDQLLDLRLSQNDAAPGEKIT